MKHLNSWQFILDLTCFLYLTCITSAFFFFFLLTQYSYMMKRFSRIMFFVWRNSFFSPLTHRKFIFSLIQLPVLEWITFSISISSKDPALQEMDLTPEALYNDDFHSFHFSKSTPKSFFQIYPRISNNYSTEYVFDSDKLFFIWSDLFFFTRSHHNG